MASYKLLVGGELIETARSIPVINPATGSEFAIAPVADEELMEVAVDSAVEAFPRWAATPLETRKRMLESLAMAIESHGEDLTELLVREGGKPLKMARFEVLRSAVRIRMNLRLPWDGNSQVRHSSTTNRVVQEPVPLGVVATIAPWNAPLLLMLNKIAPALMTGNCVVAKPAPTTPLTTLRVGEICREIFPPGVVNIITDENDLGELLTRHSRIAKVSFTGSTATGRRVMASASGTLKRVQLELGGNDPALLLDDPSLDVEACAKKIFDAAMMHAGQICFATKRVYIPDRVHDRFCEAIAGVAGRTIVGDGMDPRTEMGPLQNRMQFDRVVDLLSDAGREGTFICGGAPLDRPGYFIPPTVVTGLNESSRLVAEEQFGPVLPVLRYSEIEEAVAAMNDSPFGLGASIWATDPQRAASVAQRVVAGTVWINQHMVTEHDVPFGGFRQSGLGVENGIGGLEEFLQHRVVNVRLDG